MSLPGHAADDLGFEAGEPGSMGFQARAQQVGVDSVGHGLEAHATRVNAQAPDDTAVWTPEELDQHCDAFEEALRRGEKPTIGDFLGPCPEPQRESLFAELMQVELELHPNDAEISSYQHYLKSYPQFAGVVETIAFKHGLISPTADGDEANQLSAENLKQVAHFQFQKKLGAGGMGEVWRAWDTRLKRTVAVKIPRSRELTEEELHRFLREGRAAAQLKHPNIVPVYEVGRHGKLAYIVSDYIAGQSLQQWLEGRDQGSGVRGQGPSPDIQNNSDLPAASAVPLTAVPPQRAAELCLQLAGALHHAHQCGIVHRDLKPANILLSADGQPHVVDFGIAKWEDDTRQLTLAGYAVGTPAYMSPEQAAGNSAQVDRRADVYALGAILYRMLTGRASFAGDSVGAVLRSVIDDTPPAPRSINRAIPRDLETICIKAMDKNPARRYATAEAMGDDLARFLAGEPIVGRRPGLFEKSARLVRKRPAAAAATALALAAALAIGVAGVLARENQALQGFVPVSLETNPPGARLVFVPLDEMTQEPKEDEAVHPKTRSPVSVKLKPGDYLVVAALDGGRFHEVFRHIPRDRSEMVGTNRHQWWHWKEGEVVLWPIEIPELTVTEGMALVETPRNAENNKDGSQYPFYMDSRELTYRDCPHCLRPQYVDAQRVAQVGFHDMPITVNFDQACLFAEKMGKRLPTAAEFERAAALPRRSQCDSDQDGPLKDFGPAGTPECDQVGDQTPIAGLYSNVAEWTTTVLPDEDKDKRNFMKPPGRTFPFPNNCRIVKGGDQAVIEGDPTLLAEHRDPAASFGLERYRSKPGVGLRCVRSVSPRFLKD